MKRAWIFLLLLPALAFGQFGRDLPVLQVSDTTNVSKAVCDVFFWYSGALYKGNGTYLIRIADAGAIEDSLAAHLVLINGKVNVADSTTVTEGSYRTGKAVTDSLSAHWTAIGNRISVPVYSVADTSVLSKAVENVLYWYDEKLWKGNGVYFNQLLFPQSSPRIIGKWSFGDTLTVENAMMIGSALDPKYILHIANSGNPVFAISNTQENQVNSGELFFIEGLGTGGWYKLDHDGSANTFKLVSSNGTLVTWLRASKYMGLYTDSPLGPFHVSSATLDSLFLLTDSGAAYFESLASGTGTQLSITAQGQVVIESSSSRYKDNITNWDIDTEKLYSLQPKSFIWNEQSGCEGTKDYGLLAEDVARVFPEAVTYKNGIVQSWDERKLIVALLALLKDQQYRILQLEEKR